MRKLTGVVSLTILICVLMSGPANASIKKVAQTGLQFLKVDMTARSAAMGGAYTMTASDASAIFANPAGLAEMQYSTDFFATRTNWIANIAYNAGAVARNFGNFGVLALSFVSVDYGEMIGTQVANNAVGYIQTGSVDVGGYAVGVGYARSLTDKFSIGGQVKYAQQHLGENLLSVGGKTVENKVSGLAYDIGTKFYPGFKSFRMGMSIRNFSTQFKYAEESFQLPLTFRLGFGMDVLDLIGGLPNSSLVIDIDALHPRDYTERLHIGGEYTYANLLALRAGYKTNYDEEGLSLGFGLQYELAGVHVKFDYAYSDFGAFNNVNRITLGASF
ncbi:MAG: PorV/PorQ family protein [Calditrichota bacterium]